MNKGSTITWTTIAAAVTLLAANGGKLLELGKGAWLFLISLSQTAPLGLASFALALGLGVVSRPFLLRYLPAAPCHASRDFVIDMLAVLTGIAVMVVQLRTLNGFLLGLLAGFAAPLVAKGLGVLFAWIGRGMSGSAP